MTENQVAQLLTRNSHQLSLISSRCRRPSRFSLESRKHIRTATWIPSTNSLSLSEVALFLILSIYKIVVARRSTRVVLFSLLLRVVRRRGPYVGEKKKEDQLCAARWVRLDSARAVAWLGIDSRAWLGRIFRGHVFELSLQALILGRFEWRWEFRVAW